MNTLIYGLIDPVTRLIRYVGQTRRGMRRPRDHKSASRRLCNTHCARWITSLLARGLEFDVVVLEHCDADRLTETERWWIAYGQASGWPLTNHTDGGERDYHCDDATRARISAAGRGRKKTEEHRRKIGDAHRGRAKSEEHKRQVCGERSPMKREGVRAQQSLVLRATWSDPVSARAMLRANKSEAKRQAVADANRRRWAEPGYRERVSEAIRAARRRQ